MLSKSETFENFQNLLKYGYKLIDEERTRLYRFREIFREVMKILKHHKKEYGNIENFGNTKEKRDQSIISMICSGDRSLTEIECKIVLQKIDEFNLSPLEVGTKTKILALHPRVNTLHTGTILTSNIVSAHIQFDREDLGVCLIKDTDMMSFENGPASANPGSILLNDIRDLHLNPNLKVILNEDHPDVKVIPIPIENTEVCNTLTSIIVWWSFS